MPADWFIVKPDRELGPYTGAQIKQLAASGQLHPSHLVRRADRSEPIRAAQVRGLFDEINHATDPPASAPPPLPSEVQLAQPKGAAEPPPLPDGGASKPSLHKRIEVVKDVSRAAARLAAAEARRTQLKTVTLPAAYLALGRDVERGGRFRAEHAEISGEIDRIRSEIARLTASDRREPATNLTERAGRTAKAASDAVQAKALGLKLKAAQRKLGEAVHPIHGAESAEPTLVQPIDDALTELATIEAKLAQEEESQRGRLVTPRRVLYATAGTIVLGVFALARSGPKVTEGQATPPPAATPSSLAASEAGHGVEQIPGMEPIPVPDFSKVDYSHRCPKDDEPLPVGSKLETRFIQITKEDAKRVGRPDEGGDSYVGQWAEEQGYKAQNGSFVLHGVRTAWFDQNRLRKREEGSWLHGKQHGSRTIWFESGNVLSKVHFAHGEPHGHGQTWFDNGKPWGDEWYYEGKKHGIARLYYTSGKQEAEQTYVEGQRQGPDKAWHENGQIWISTSYLGDQEHGIHKEWYPNGQLQAEVHWQRGSKEGLYRGWFDNGKLREESNWLHDELNGSLTKFFPNGAPRLSWTYENGRIVYVRGGDIDLFIKKLDDICAHEPGCGGRLPPGLNVRKDIFLRFFGEPDSDIGASGNERFWRYRCRDGLLVLTVADLGSNLLVKDYSWIQRENPLADGLGRQEMLKLLASQVGEDRTQALGDRRAIEKVPIDGTWWFDKLGKPTVLESLNDRGGKLYAYRCSDGVIGFEVQEYYRPDSGIRAIAIESVDLP